MPLPEPVLPLCLGGNVFGWTADADESFAVLDAFADAGGTYVDTADAYSSWVDGNEGGESETILGDWFARSGRREDVFLATKVGALPARKGLAAENIRRACEDSLRRLQTDRIDLYYAHFDDPDTPLAETLGAFDGLVRDGLVRYVGLSNYEPDRLREALDTAVEQQRTVPVALQPKYSLVEREYEASRQPIAEQYDLAVLPYYALASGFLSGKYRAKREDVSAQRVDKYRAGDAEGSGSPRAEGAAKYLESERGPRILEALDAVAEETGAPVSAIAVAWIGAQPTVLAPIASARTPEQLADLVQVRDLRLSGDQLQRLDAASR